MIFPKVFLTLHGFYNILVMLHTLHSFSNWKKAPNTQFPEKKNFLFFPFQVCLGRGEGQVRLPGHEREAPRGLEAKLIKLFPNNVCSKLLLPPPPPLSTAKVEYGATPERGFEPRAEGLVLPPPTLDSDYEQQVKGTGRVASKKNCQVGSGRSG